MHLFIEKGRAESRWRASGTRSPTTQQPAGRRPRPHEAELQIHHVLGREQLVRLGHEPAATRRRLVTESDAHSTADYEV